MRSYYRIMLGKKSVHADACFRGNFIGADFGFQDDLTGRLPENWREFNHACIPIYLHLRPEKSKVTAGLACGALHTVAKGIRIGDIVFYPNGSGSYLVGEVTSDYSFQPGQILPHRRKVHWFDRMIERSEMTDALRNSSGSIGTVSNISKYSVEIESLLHGASLPELTSSDPEVEDPSVFALEKHLEEFLIQNWQHTEFGPRYDIYEEDGELVGQQYPSDTGPIDILAISKDRSELLVVELKKRACQ